MATWYLEHCSGISNCAAENQTDRSKSCSRGFGVCIRYKHGLVEGHNYEARRMLGRSQKRFPNVVRRYPRYDIEVLGCLPGRPEVPSPRPSERYRLRPQKRWTTRAAQKRDITPRGDFGQEYGTCKGFERDDGVDSLLLFQRLVPYPEACFAPL